MGTNSSPLQADIILYSKEAELMQSLLFAGKQLSSQFNFTSITLSINNIDFDTCNNLGQMYTAELEIKDTTEGNTSASCFNLRRSAVQFFL